MLFAVLVENYWVAMRSIHARAGAIQFSSLDPCRPF